jgi:hypothetical protein
MLGIHAITGPCAEVGGKRSSIHRVGLIAVPRKDGIETKFAKALRIASDEFDLIHLRRKLAVAVRLEGANEDQSAVVKHVAQGCMLAGEIVPGQIGSFHEKDFGFIPARNFDTAGIRAHESFPNKHDRLRERVSRFQAREWIGTR